MLDKLFKGKDLHLTFLTQYAKVCESREAQLEKVMIDIENLNIEIQQLEQNFVENIAASYDNPDYDANEKLLEDVQKLKQKIEDKKKLIGPIEQGAEIALNKIAAEAIEEYKKAFSKKHEQYEAKRQEMESIKEKLALVVAEMNQIEDEKYALFQILNDVENKVPTAAMDDQEFINIHGFNIRPGILGPRSAYKHNSWVDIKYGINSDHITKQIGVLNQSLKKDEARDKKIKLLNEKVKGVNLKAEERKRLLSQD
ncbi:hypothetical protein AAGS61_02165 [Lysinibacillus sp. KU-BSD001]|uniref:hypothetical protein n=1 Tax=Lysinibacillus sp. KU-BSD001 TaxID=3141328 RepID=UPI0036E7FA65